MYTLKCIYPHICRCQTPGNPTSLWELHICTHILKFISCSLLATHLGCPIPTRKHVQPCGSLSTTPFLKSSPLHPHVSAADCCLLSQSVTRAKSSTHFMIRLASDLPLLAPSAQIQAIRVCPNSAQSRVRSPQFAIITMIKSLVSVAPVPCPHPRG